MTEFWESSFRDKQEMWGWKPADSAIETVALFKKKGLHKILVPGFGYGRNAKIFIDNGFEVAGIEISETAIAMAKEHLGERIKIHHGPTSSMPFDQEVYDGIFSYSLIHLLNPKERTKLIKDCYNQLRPGGLMIFVSISKKDFRYGEGEEIRKDTFKRNYGVTLFFYDSESIRLDFGHYGLVEAKEINEPLRKLKDQFSQRFWYIICAKEEK